MLRQWSLRLIKGRSIDPTKGGVYAGFVSPHLLRFYYPWPRFYGVIQMIGIASHYIRRMRR